MKYSPLCLVVLLWSCNHDLKTIKIKGSDTEVNLAVQLAEAFHDIHPNDFVSISGGGSGLGSYQAIPTSVGEIRECMFGLMCFSLR
jgi:phosphate transport system substrate-binding protein